MPVEYGGKGQRAQLAPGGLKCVFFQAMSGMSKRSLRGEADYILSGFCRARMRSMLSSRSCGLKGLVT